MTYEPLLDVKGARILVVDDHADSREALAAMLALFGAQVELAADAARGLTLARRSMPALVFCDLRMPEIDGFEFLRRLRLVPEIARTPVVAVTALPERDTLMRTWEAGFSGHVTKPITPEILEAQLFRVFWAH